MKRNEFLFNVFVTACEGGINYFANVEEYRIMDDAGNDLHDGFYAVVSDCEEEDFESLRVDANTIEEGIEIISQPDFEMNSTIKASIVSGSIDIENADIDANGADCIVQCGLFGKLVYG